MAFPSVDLPPQQRTLLDVMRRVQEGDEAAFGDLYGRTHCRVYQIVDRVTRAPDHSAEVVQEVFLQVWERAASFDTDRGSVMSWLGMLAHRRAVDRVRQVVQSQARDHHSSSADDAVGVDVAELGMARHEAARVRVALRALPPRQAQAVAATFLCGLTHRDAARLLSIPEGTLKTRVRDGLKALRRQLLPSSDPRA